MKSLLLGLAAATVCVRGSDGDATNDYSEWETASDARSTDRTLHPNWWIAVAGFCAFNDKQLLALTCRNTRESVIEQLCRQYEVDRALFDVICLPMPKQSSAQLRDEIKANYAQSSNRVCGITEDGVNIRLCGQLRVQREYPRVRVNAQPIMDGEEFIDTMKERDGIAKIVSVKRGGWSEPRLNVATAYTPRGCWELLPGRRVCEYNGRVVSVINLDTCEVELRYTYDTKKKRVDCIMDHFVVFYVSGTRQHEFFPLWQHSTEPAYTLRIPLRADPVADAFFTRIDHTGVLRVLSLQPDNTEQFSFALPQGFYRAVVRYNNFGLCAVSTNTHYVLFDLHTRLQLGPTRVGEFSHFHLSLPHVFDVVNPDRSLSVHCLHDCETALYRLPKGFPYDGGYVDFDNKLKLQVQTDEARTPE
jgi:hypothetical protein